MPTLEEVAARVNFLMEQGGHDRKCHFGLVDVEAKERIANAGPKKRTRFIKEMDSAETYSQMNAAFDRFISLTGNPQIAFQLILELLAALPDESIVRMAQADQQLISSTERK